MNDFAGELGFFVPEGPPTPPLIGLDTADRAIVENYVSNVGLGSCPLVSGYLKSQVKCNFLMPFYSISVF